MKRIILKYSSLPLFGSFNGGNGKSIPLFGSLGPRLGEGNRMEWKIMKRIILEYSSLILFGSFNGGNGMDRKEHSFLSIPLKPQIFIPPEIGRNERE